MRVIIGNWRGGKSYITIETCWMNIIPADLRNKDDNERYCNVQMLVQREDLSKLYISRGHKSCIKDLYMHDNGDSALVVEFVTSENVNCLEEE